jgi:FAD synthase
MSDRDRPRPLALHELPPIGPAAVTLGVFDGVHRGHRALLEMTGQTAREHGWRSVALVFDPHPDEVLRPGTRVPRLAPLAVILDRIQDDAGVDHALPLRFDDALRSLTAEEFLEALAPSITLRAIVVSPESAFGRGRGGTVDRLREIGAEAGFTVVTVEPVLLGGEPISSMRIRDALNRGSIAEATAFGYAPAVTGVLDGPRIGFSYLPALPRPGRYRATLSAAAREGERATTAIVEVGSDGSVRLVAGLDGALPEAGPQVVTVELIEAV